MGKQRKAFLYTCFLFALVGGVLIIRIVADPLFDAGFLPPRSKLPVMPDYYSMAASRIEIGDEREQVIQAMSDAWYHCVDDDSQMPESYRGYTDYFFYGPENFDQATVIIVSSEITRGSEIVSHIGSFENYLWCIALDCLPPQFQDRCEELQEE